MFASRALPATGAHRARTSCAQGTPSCTARCRRLVVRSSAAEPSNPDADDQPSTSAPGLVKVPLSELPKPNARAFRTLNKSMTKTGVSRLVVDSLDGVPLTVVGDDHDLCAATGQVLATRLGWFPTTTSRILMGMTKAGSLAELTSKLGHEKLADMEAGGLRGLRTQRRVITATLPGAATARRPTFDTLFGTIILWVDEEDKSAPKPASPERALWASAADVTVRLKKGRGFSTSGSKPEERGREAAEAAVPLLVEALNRDPGLVARKHEYTRLGSRGDWPELKPAEWSPVLEGLPRTEAA